MRETNYLTGKYVGTIVVIILIGALIGAVLWPYTINTWLEYFGHEPVIEWYHGAILGFVPLVGQATIPAAALTWISMLIL